MRTRNAQLLRTIAEMTYARMGMYHRGEHDELAMDIVSEVAEQLGVPWNYLDAINDDTAIYLVSFGVRIGNHSIIVPRIFSAINNREAIFKARNLQALLFPGEGRVDDNGVYFFSGGEVAVRLEKLVSINPFDLSVEESIQDREAA